MEELYFDLKKGEYIKIIGDEIEVKRTFLDAYGVRHKSEVVRDKIENFTLMYFKVSLKVDIIMNLVNEQKNYFDHIVSTVGKENAKGFEVFRDIMEQHGRFENRSKYDVYYGDYTIEKITKKIREKERYKAVSQEYSSMKEGEGGKSKELTEDQAFYDQLKTLPGFNVSGTRKELHHLRTILYEGEQVLAVTSGFMDDNTWLIACTDKRVLFIDCGMLYGVNHTEVLIEKINACHLKIV